MSIQAVIFDLGRVIVPFELERGFSRLAAACNLTTEEIGQRIVATGLVRQFETGLMETDEFIAKASAALGVRLKRDEFSEIWNAIFLPETLVPEEMLTGLKRKYRLLLLSNTNALHYEWLEKQYPLLRHFEHKVLSHEVRMVKPDAGIYRHAAALAGCGAEACLFIDDLPENVAGAQAVGMQAVLFRSREELERDFDRLGVEWRADAAI